MRKWMVLAFAVAGSGAVLALARRALLVIRVDGTSMMPTFRPGDAVLTVRRRVRPRVRRDDIVVCRPPSRRYCQGMYLIKRVAAVGGDPMPDDYHPPADDDRFAGASVISAGYVYLRGDGEPSVDSRTFGPVPLDHVVGHVVARMALKSGAGVAAGQPAA